MYAKFVGNGKQNTSLIMCKGWHTSSGQCFDTGNASGIQQEMPQQS